MTKPDGSMDGRLLRCHKLHLGLYTRVAKDVRATAGYISLVAAGKRQNDKIRQAILTELWRIEKIKNVD